MTVQRAGLAILALAAHGLAQQASYEIRPDSASHLTLTVEKTGLLSGKKHTFVFPAYRGLLRYDAKAPESSSITLNIQPAAIQCQDTWLSGSDLRKVQEYAVKDMLAASRYPSISFRSTSIRQTRADQFDVQGELTIREITKPATVVVTRSSATNGDLRFDGQSVFRLTDYSLKPPSAALGAIGTRNEVTLRFRLTASRATT